MNQFEKNLKQKQERLGEENHNKFGTLMKIIEYVNANDITIEFQDEYKTRVHTAYKCFKNGGVKNPYDKEVFNVGYMGKGKYKTWENSKHTDAYISWRNMLRRCYDPYFLNKELTYIDCYVCDEWLCFQNFAEWYYKNYYKCNNELMCLDKDILYKGNKIYSPNTCIFVPQRINNLFTKSNKTRGKKLIGVCYHNRDNVLEAWCCNKECKQQYLGRFNNEKDAFNCYKQFKEGVIKQIANEYKNLIPRKLYEAIYNYKVEVGD